MRADPTPIFSAGDIRAAVAHRRRLKLDRGTRRAPAIRPPRRVEAEYFVALKGVATDLLETIRARVLPEVSRLVSIAPRDLRADSAGEVARFDEFDGEVDRLMGGVKVVFLGAAAPKIRAAAARAAKATASAQKIDQDRAVGTVLGLRPELAEPWLEPVMDSFTRANVKLIQGFTDAELQRVERRITDGVRQGQQASAIAAALNADLKEKLPVERAKFIARDQIASLYGDIARVRQQKLGIKRYTWVTSEDERVRPTHQQRSGEVFTWEPIEPQLRAKGLKVDKIDGHPGRPISCFPASTEVLAFEGAKKFFRRWYEGELATIVTDDGRRLSATPNHPILTRRGWLPLKSLKVGDEIFCATPKGGLNVKGQDAQQKTTMGQAFESARMGAASMARPGAAGDFHGDGADQDVDVVDLDRLLPRVRHPARLKKLCEEILTRADETRFALSDFSEHIVRAFHASHGVMRSAGKLKALIRGEISHPESVGLAATAWLDVALEQLAANGLSLDAVLASRRELAHAGDVVGDSCIDIELFAVVRWAVTPLDGDAMSAERLAEIVSVDAESGSYFGEPEALFEIHALRIVEVSLDLSWSGHVYNLETSNGWYSAGGLVAHNCRCIAQPIFEDLLDGLPEVDDEPSATTTPDIDFGSYYPPAPAPPVVPIFEDLLPPAPLPSAPVVPLFEDLLQPPATPDAKALSAAINANGIEPNAEEQPLRLSFRRPS